MSTAAQEYVSTLQKAKYAANPMLQAAFMLQAADRWVSMQPVDRELAVLLQKQEGV